MVIISPKQKTSSASLALIQFLLSPSLTHILSFPPWHFPRYNTSSPIPQIISYLSLLFLPLHCHYRRSLRLSVFSAHHFVALCSGVPILRTPPLWVCHLHACPPIPPLAAPFPPAFPNLYPLLMSPRFPEPVTDCYNFLPPSSYIPSHPRSSSSTHSHLPLNKCSTWLHRSFNAFLVLPSPVSPALCNTDPFISFFL